MWLLSLAWKNMWRNRHRTMVTTASLFFAVVLSILTSSLRTGIFDHLIQNMVGYYSGYIQIHARGYWDERILDNMMTYDSLLAKTIADHDGITAASPRLESFALASTGDNTKGVLVAGVDPALENALTALKKRLISGTYIQQHQAGVGLAEGLAARLKLHLGDTLYLIGQGYHGSIAAGKFPVSGMYRFGSPELNDKMIYMPLEQAQELYGAGAGITSFALSIKDPEKLSAITSDLEQMLGQSHEVMTWEQMMPDIKQHIEADTQNMQVVHWILYFLIAFGVLGTLMMMMVERSFEMGMLLAIGMRKSLLALVLIVESIATVGLGCILGIAASFPLVKYLHDHPLRIGGPAAKAYERFGFEAIFPTSVHYSHFVDQGIVVFLLGLLMSSYMLYKVITLDPVRAMKK